MRISMYPGSFDPITYGHIDIIRRAAKMTDKLIVAVLNNADKKSLFTESERVSLVREAVHDIENVEVESFEGLTIDFARQKGVNTLVRGLRAVTDFEYEFQIAQTNHEMDRDIDTIFLLTNLRYSYLSSSIVKEIASHKSDISKFVPECVEKAVLEKYK